MITVNSANIEWHDGMTVEDVLRAMNYNFNMLAIWLNGEPISGMGDYSGVPVPDGSKMQVIHLFAGG